MAQKVPQERKAEQQSCTNLLTAGPQWETEQQQMDFGDTATAFAGDQAGMKQSNGLHMTLWFVHVGFRENRQKEKLEEEQLRDSTAETALEFNPPSSPPGCN